MFFRASKFLLAAPSPKTLLGGFRAPQDFPFPLVRATLACSSLYSLFPRLCLLLESCLEKTGNKKSADKKNQEGRNVGNHQKTYNFRKYTLLT